MCYPLLFHKQTLPGNASDLYCYISLFTAVCDKNKLNFIEYISVNIFLLGDIERMLIYFEKSRTGKERGMLICCYFFVISVYSISY